MEFFEGNKVQKTVKKRPKKGSKKSIEKTKTLPLRAVPCPTTFTSATVAVSFGDEAALALDDAGEVRARSSTDRPSSSPRTTHPAEIHKGLLENRRDANGQASVVGNINRNETSAVLATHTVQIPIPGSVRLVENHAELYPRNRWMDTATYLHSTQTISKSCSAALLNHDYTYYMDESDKMWLDNTNYQCRIEERIAQEPQSADTQEICGCSTYNMRACEHTSCYSVCLRETKLHQELPDFSIFKPFFLAQLHPDTFASHVVPSWIRPPSVLSSIALIIHSHWHQRRWLQGGRKICPSLNTGEDDHINVQLWVQTNTGAQAIEGRGRGDSFTTRLGHGHCRRAFMEGRI
ncbi:hypothetical protein B0H14DRAFT_3718626 [Mycena olivaceomarginata]|nr:hypothetical protein B0H14DRAFT_3718626 [Mycena olivaceomarginata]